MIVSKKHFVKLWCCIQNTAYE